ncbi:MAG: S49 family peptidase [Planctomycetota bacterium]
MPDVLTIPEEARRFARLTDYFGPWAIHTPVGVGLFEKTRGMDLQAHVAERRQAPALQTQHVRAMDGTGQGVGGGVQLIRLDGVLMKHVNSLDDGTSTVQARTEIRRAAADPFVDGIMLVIDSPGGTCSGTADLAMDVAAAAAVKPVHVHVEDLCASAGYWVASQADRISANNGTAWIGSIGTYLGLYDFSGLAAKEGVEAVLFSTGPLKGAGFPGAKITDAQREHFQERVDGLQQEFSAAVAAGRGLPVDRVTPGVDGTLATGGVWGANEAMELGLVDAVEDFDTAMAALLADVRERRDGGGSGGDSGGGAGRGGRAADENTTRSDAMDKDDAKKDNTQTAAQASEPFPGQAQDDQQPAADTSAGADAEQVATSGSKPEASDDAGKGDTPAERPSVKEQAQPFLSEFGDDQGAKYFAQGLSIDEARQAENKRLKAELDKAKAAQPAGGASASEAVPFKPDGEQTKGRSAHDYATRKRAA